MSELDSIRQLPHSLQAEQAVLGAIIIDPEKLVEAAELSADHFYPETHKTIFKAIKNLFAESRTIDVVTLIDEIKKAFGDTDFDAAKYIKIICDVAVENTNIGEYIRIIKEKATLRALIGASRDISEKAYSESGDVRSLVDYSERRIFEVADERYRTGLTHISETIKENYDKFQTLAGNPDIYEGIKTGFSELDEYFVSLGEGDLVLIGARPGVGKTTFALNLALNVGIKYPEKEIAIFSLEMTKEQLVNRLISCQALIDNYTIKKASFTSEQWGTLADACSKISETQIYLDDTSEITVTEMKSKVRRLKNVGLIIIDYLGLMQSESHKDNRVLEVADLTRSLKLMAKEMKIPIILVSQLSRPAKGLKEKRPTLSDLRDSGAIEQDADIVMLLYRDDYDTGEEQKNEPKSEQQIVECIIGKNRHGQTGTVKFAWYGQYFKYVQLEEKYDDRQEPKQ